MGVLQVLSLRGLDPLRAVTSNLVSPYILLATRSVSFFYELIILIGSIAYQPTQGWIFLTFFTHLSFIGEFAYFGVAAYHTFRFTRAAGYVSPTLQSDSLWTRAHYILYSTIAVFHLMVPVIYWSILYNDSTVETQFSMFLNVSKHAVDLVLLAVEFILGRMTLCWGTLPWLVATVLFYMFWSWVAHAINGVWVYPFLAWEKPAGVVAGWYIGMAVLLVVFFVISYYAHQIRDRLLRLHAERVEDNERLRRELRYRTSSAAVEMRGQGSTFTSF